MADKITFQQLIDEFSDKSGRTKAFSSKFIKDIFISIQEGLRKDENVNIKGMGIFKLQEVAERETLNPKTGRSALIEAHKKIVYRPEKALRERVNQKYADLEPKILGKKEDLAKSEAKPDLNLKPTTESNSETDTTSMPEAIPSFPKHTPSSNRNPITSSITNEDGSIDIKKIFGSDDLPTDDELKKENPMLDDEILTQDENISTQAPVQDSGPQTLEELIQVTKSSENTIKQNEDTEHEKPLETESTEKSEPIVFGDKPKNETPDLSGNLPWLNDSSNQPESNNNGSKISPTFIIEKRTHRSAWRWLFPLFLILLIVAVIYFVPNNSIQFNDLAFWKNWKKITLFEAKDKDSTKVQEKKVIKTSDTLIADNKTKNEQSPDNDSSQNKIGNIFLKLKERGTAAQDSEKNSLLVPPPVKELKTITQSHEDEKVLIHIVQEGNTLWGLSNQYYQRSSLWPNIYRKNIEVLPTPDFLPLGRKLLIPELNGNSHELSKADSARIAQGYYLAYSAYKKYDEEKAQGYLNMAKRFSTTIK